MNVNGIRINKVLMAELCLRMPQSKTLCGGSKNETKKRRNIKTHNHIMFPKIFSILPTMRPK